MKLAAFSLTCLSLLPVVLSASVPQLSSNAKRLARGLPPLPPRRLFNANVVRDVAPSQLPTSASSASSAASSASASASSASSAPSTPAGPPIGTVQAVSVGTPVSGQTSSPPIRRDTIGNTVGYLNQVGRLQTTPSNTRYGLTDDDAGTVHGLYAVDYQFPPSPTTPAINSWMGISNLHSSNWSHDYAVPLASDSGDWVGVGNCDSASDQPAGSPPTNDPNSVEPQYYCETRSWNYDPASGTLSSYYVNPDGTFVPQIFVIFTCPDWPPPTGLSGYVIYVTGNIQLWRDNIAATLVPGSTADPDACTATQIELFYTLS